MKPWLVLLALGTLALFFQGVAGVWLPARWLPNLGLLLIVAAAIGLRSTAGGVLFAAILGYSADCLSGALLGQQMLLAVAAYGVARAAATRLNLRGPLPQVVCVSVLTLGHAAALWALIGFVGGTLVSPRLVVPDALVNALATGIAAPFVTEAVVRLLGRLGEDEGQRPLRLASRALAR